MKLSGLGLLDYGLELILTISIVVVILLNSILLLTSLAFERDRL